MKLAIDPGHGMSNRRAGVFDPGCLRGDLQEADIVLDWAKALENACNTLGISTFLTRRDNTTPLPVGTRAGLARSKGCTHLISIHVNDADGRPTGVETLWRENDFFAKLVHTCLLHLGLRDRGLKQRTDLAVLKFGGPCALLELGFIGNASDMKAVNSLTNVENVCECIARTLQNI